MINISFSETNKMKTVWKIVVANSAD